MKVVKIHDDNKTVLLEIGDGAFVAVHSHWPGECEIQFAGIEGTVSVTSPVNKDRVTSGIGGVVFARYKVKNKNE